MFDLTELVFWHWWVLAAALVGLEMLMPTTVLLWPGLAAAITGFVLAAAPGLEWQAQIFVFAILAVISVALARVYYRMQPQETADSGLNRRAERYINQQFTLQEPIVGGEGTLCGWTTPPGGSPAKTWTQGSGSGSLRLMATCCRWRPRRRDPLC